MHFLGSPEQPLVHFSSASLISSQPVAGQDCEGNAWRPNAPPKSESPIMDQELIMAEKLAGLSKHGLFNMKFLVKKKKKRDNHS